MFFPLDNTKLDLVPPESFTSLGDDAAFLLLTKKHCGLPADASWTELDSNLKLLLDAAESFVDNLCSCQFRPRTFVLYLSPTDQAKNSPRTAVDMTGCRFTSIKLPKSPISEATVEFLNVDDSSFTEVTDFRIIAPNSHSPEIVFNRDVVLPNTDKPYPVQVTFTTTANKTNSLQKMAILTLVDFFFKNPESFAKQPTDGIAGVFGDILYRLGAGGYA